MCSLSAQGPSNFSYVGRWTPRRVVVYCGMHRTAPPPRRYRPPGWSSRSLFGKHFAPETLLIPVVFATKLANVLPSTTLYELFRQAVCRLSNASNGDQSSIVVGGLSNPELCDVPEVVRNIATVFVVLDVMGGIICEFVLLRWLLCWLMDVPAMVGSGFLNQISPRYGRKPIFLFILIMEVMWSCLIIGSQFMSDKLSDIVFFLGIFIEKFTRSFPFHYLVNMYIIDVCVPENRWVSYRCLHGGSNSIL